jgi:hypothetical protein
MPACLDRPCETAVFIKLIRKQSRSMQANQCCASSSRIAVNLGVFHIYQPGGGFVLKTNAEKDILKGMVFKACLEAASVSQSAFSKEK